MSLKNDLLKIVFGVFVILLFYAQKANADILITEVQIYGENVDNDFVKVYNNSETALDVSGYKIRKRSSTGKESSVVKFPKGSVIQAKNYFVWANSKNNFSSTIGANVWTAATLSKNNSISLLTPDGVILDALAWGESENQFVKGFPFPENPSKNQSLKRKLVNNVYQNTSNNKDDFYLDPPLINRYNDYKDSSASNSYLVAQEQQNKNQLSEDEQTSQENISQQPPFSSENKKVASVPIFQNVQSGEQKKLIDINTASLSELQMLNGIGPVLAQRIIDYRVFYSVDELIKVPGIGSKTLAEIKKQGLAWVDPSLEKQKNPIESTKQNSLQANVGAAQLKPVAQQYISNSTKKSLLIFFIALVIAVICTIVVLSLKINYKKN